MPSRERQEPAVSALLGVVWVVVTGIALASGAVTLAIWLAGVAGLAAVQAGRSWRHDKDRHPGAYAAGVGAAVVVLGSAFGVPGFVVGAVGGLVAAGAWASSTGADVALTTACAAVPAAAAAMPVLLRATDGLVPALVLLSYATVFDLASHIMGTDAKWRWEGTVAGMACIGSVTLGVAAIFPQFKGNSPWELGLAAAVAAPLGPLVANRVVGSRGARVPALRRLDSLTVLGPVWAVAAALLVSG
jgi:hypothetical protein